MLLFELQRLSLSLSANPSLPNPFIPSLPPSLVPSFIVYLHSYISRTISSLRVLLHLLLLLLLPSLSALLYFFICPRWKPTSPLASFPFSFNLINPSLLRFVPFLLLFPTFSFLKSTTIMLTTLRYAFLFFFSHFDEMKMNDRLKLRSGIPRRTSSPWSLTTPRFCSTVSIGSACGPFPQVSLSLSLQLFFSLNLLLFLKIDSGFL